MEPNYNPRLDPAIKYIQDNPHEMPSMTDMAKLCGLSNSYFSRLFHKELGVNFVAYLNNKKIADACRILERNSSVSVMELSRDLGFSDASYFIRIFRRITGTTPYAYRKKYYRR